MNSRLLSYRPPRIAQLLLLAAALLHLTSPVSVPLYASVWPGAAMLCGGFCFMIVAWLQFKKHQTAICPTDRPGYLVTDGVYRITRNPMYLGIFAMMLGLALLVGSLPFYVAAVAWIIVIDVNFCRYEEARLLEEFGADYLAYRSRVRRWI